MIKLKNLSIKKKLIIIVLSVVATVFLVISIFQIGREITAEKEDMLTLLLVQTDMAAEHCQAPLFFEDYQSLKENLEILHRTPDIINAFIYGREGNLLSSYHKTKSDFIHFEPDKAVTEKFSGGFITIKKLIQQDGREIGTLYIRASDKSLRITIQYSILFYTLTFIVSLIIAWLLALVMQNVISAPILSLAKITRRITGDKDFSLRATKKGTDEIGLLCDDFNSMLSYIEQNRKFLAKSEKRFREMTDLLPQIVYEIDVNGNYTYLNKATKYILGYSNEDIQNGLNIVDIFVPEDINRVRQEIEGYLKGSQLKKGTEYSCLRKDGSRIPVIIYTKSIITNNVVTGIRGIKIDITEREQAEQLIKQKNDEYLIANEELNESLDRIQQINIQLKKAKELAEESERLKSAFLANMSHEIRTPMNGIIGFTDLLKTPNLTGDQQQEFIDIIQKSGNRMLNTVNDIIAISKIHAGQELIHLNKFNLFDEIQSLFYFFKPQAETKGLSFKLQNDIPESGSNFLCDKSKFSSILSNLIKNAIKFTHEGEIQISCIKKGNIIKCSVKDTGIGISTNRIKAVFKRFVQEDIEDSSAIQGSGLGLTIAKSYVEMLGGEIGIESEKGKGSVFFFTLPWEIHQQHNKLPAKPSTIKNTRNKKLKILIAEDDEVSFKYLSTSLDKITDNILWAKTGTEAVKIEKNNPDINIIFMDIKMPELNGYDATRKIREHNTDVVIIAQTAYAMPEDNKKAIEVGCNEYISKPINNIKLLQLIDTLKQ